MTLWHAEGLLDEVPTQQTRRLLQRALAEWDFNAFVLDRLTSGRNLATLCTHLLQENGLLRHYRLDPLVVRKFFYLVEQASLQKILVTKGKISLSLFLWLHALYELYESTKVSLSLAELPLL